MSDPTHDDRTSARQTVLATIDERGPTERDALVAAVADEHDAHEAERALDQLIRRGEVYYVPDGDNRVVKRT